jgi:hypothetical protein
MDSVTATETKRDRVRRVLFGPLGFRRPGNVIAGDHEKALDALADELGYMSEENLEALQLMLRSKGAGRDRNVWPDRATVRALAEIVQPRPLAELPGLIRWFRSIEGPRAVANGTLVETWQYFERFKAPPVTPGARARLAEQARDNARRLQIVAERRAAGWSNDPAELEFERWYAERRAYCAGMVAEARDGKAPVEDAA